MELKLICSLCEAGNLSQDVNGVLVHVVENYSEGKAALVECAHSPIHVGRLTKTPVWSE